jgi:DNA polymerase-3 subunit delta'
MLKDLLKQQQPIVYQALNNACLADRVSSAYLFTGPFGTPKYEAAILLAESIFCEKQDGLACEECNTCRRVREGSYADLIILDGQKKAVSKEDVDALQERFSKTALEKNGQRVYIIRNCENASISAQNSMLKFLEEPGAGVTAILTTDNVNKILPTILSRCTVLPFLPLSEKDYIDAAVKADIPAEDARFLSHIARDTESIRSLYEGEEYANAMNMFRQYLNLDGMSRRDLLVDYEISWKSHASDREKAKKSDLVLLGAFFDLLNMYFHDVLMHDGSGPAWYHDVIVNAPGKPEDYANLIRIITEERDKVNRFNDLNLLMDQAYYRLEVYNHDHRL